MNNKNIIFIILFLLLLGIISIFFQNIIPYLIVGGIFSLMILMIILFVNANLEENKNG